MYVSMSILDKPIGHGFRKNNNVFAGRGLDHHHIPYIKIRSRWAEKLNAYKHILRGNKCKCECRVRKDFLNINAL